MFQVAQGIDPIDAKREKIEAAASAAEGTVQAVCALWLDLAGSKIRSHDYYESVLKRHVYPKLGAIEVVKLKRVEIVAAFDHVERTSGGRTQTWHSPSCARSCDGTSAGTIRSGAPLLLACSASMLPSTAASGSG